ncbi:hypothetical protein EDD36DRAFT_462859 [Exophiala viscosa]|uniref:Myb-like domain-containing protein n=1 Tax=Exophiala viscosa TaxID=2486360 RepID=A0AAN6E057_9EURO|nr:hypothetical protein EDD36DRAFT_462859 [Exophiala viscosa]
MVFKWDNESERALLLLAITEMQAPKSTVWPAVAEKLGGGLNASACSQKFYKLKKESEKLLGGGDTATTNAPTTPKTTKVKGENGTTGRATGGKRKKATTDQDADLGDTPSKKKAKPAPNEEVKLEPVAAGENKAVKVEESLEEED